MKSDADLLRDAVDLIDHLRTAVSWLGHPPLDNEERVRHATAAMGSALGVCGIFRQLSFRYTKRLMQAREEKVGVR